MQKCMLHVVQSLSIAVMVEWRVHGTSVVDRCCSALGIDPVGSVHCISVL